ncbi:MAG: hypothetical protein HYT94_02475 [Parcubacteria group bacterium]|nr:hypothetical protein [Parcubacteria group bacterium]
MTWYTFLTLSHIIGTILGAGGATFAEILSLQALKDGVIDPAETALLRLTYRVLRIGLIILVLSGFGYLLWYRMTGDVAMLYEPRILAKLTILFFTLLAVIAWQAKMVPSWLGSAGSIVSWYALILLGTWRELGASYVSIMVIYLVALTIASFAMLFVHKKILP